MPPKPVESQLVVAARQQGEALFFGRAGCIACHSLGGRGEQIRGPNLGVAAEWEEPVGVRAAQRKPELAAIEYLVESIVDPDAFTVPKYPMAVMKAPDEAPIGLTDDELVALAVFLAASGVPAPVEAAALTTARARLELARAQRQERRAKNQTEAVLARIDWQAGDPKHGADVFKALGCASCHGNPKAKPDARGLLPPDLTGIGKRLSPKEIARWVVDPPQNRMPSFATSVAGADLAALAAYVAGR